ncbi:MAG: chemotaxis protein CheW [Bacteroidota bacterium]
MGADGDDLHSVVIFRLSGELFAIPVAEVREVVPYAWLEQPPRMPTFIQGVLNLGGLAVPVLRLDVLLGTPSATIGLDASILIMKTDDAPLALLVEHVEGVRAAADFQYAAIDDRQSFQGCLAGQLSSPTFSVHLLSWHKVLLEEEGRRLEQFQHAAQVRLAELVDGEA